MPSAGESGEVPRARAVPACPTLGREGTLLPRLLGRRVRSRLRVRSLARLPLRRGGGSRRRGRMGHVERRYAGLGGWRVRGSYSGPASSSPHALLPLGRWRRGQQALRSSCSIGDRRSPLAVDRSLPLEIDNLCSAMLSIRGMETVAGELQFLRGPSYLAEPMNVVALRLEYPISCLIQDPPFQIVISRSAPPTYAFFQRIVLFLLASFTL